MPDTTPQPSAPPSEVKAPGCPTCRTTHTIVTRNAVTVNVPAATYQYRCGGCGTVLECPAEPGSPSLWLLMQARVPYVPRGSSADLEARVMAARVFWAEPCPQWPGDDQ